MLTDVVASKNQDQMGKKIRDKDHATKVKAVAASTDRDRTDPPLCSRPD